MSAALVELLERHTRDPVGESPFSTPIEGLHLLRAEHRKRPAVMIFKPALCIVAQGAKWALFDGKRVEYRAGQALVVSVELPMLGCLAEASPRAPFLGLVIELDLGILREVMDGLEDLPAALASGPARGGVFVAEFTGPMSDCALRLVRLLDTPKAIPVLRASILRELSYWLLASPFGAEIAQLALAKSHTRRLISAIHWLRQRYAKAVRIDELAAVAKMSPSAFHKQFKALTSMTPLQYQKQLRLIESRRLMLTEGANVETAAFQVGYESASQFSREYSRMFGAPPKRDVAGLRSNAA